MKLKRQQPVAEPIVFTRADPVALARFDPRTKVCSMNCGPHAADQRSATERKFLCPECYEIPPPKCDDSQQCSPEARYDEVSHGLTSLTLKCRLCGGIRRSDWD